MFDFDFVKQQIKMFVTIDDVFRRYVPYTEKREGRYKCPFNPNEKRYNFGIKGRTWRCFSCNCFGDEISFVQKLFDLSAPEAIKKIAADFNIRSEVNSEDDLKLKKEIERRIQQRERARARDKAIKDLQNKLYIYVIDKIKECESTLELYKPYNKNNLGKYMFTKDCEEYLKACAKLEKYNEYADILGEVPDYILDKQELYQRMYNFVNKVYKGELKI